MWNFIYAPTVNTSIRTKRRNRHETNNHRREWCYQIFQCQCVCGLPPLWVALWIGQGQSKSNTRQLPNEGVTMKLTIESDEGEKAEVCFVHGLFCPLLNRQFKRCEIGCEIECGDIIGIPDKCPFKKKEKKIKVCCQSMSPYIITKSLRYNGRFEMVMDKNDVVTSVMSMVYCPWCGKKIELE